MKKKLQLFQEKLGIFFHYLNNLILTNKDEEVSRTDTSPFRFKVSVPWSNVTAGPHSSCNLSPAQRTFFISSLQLSESWLTFPTPSQFWQNKIGIALLHLTDFEILLGS